MPGVIPGASERRAWDSGLATMDTSDQPIRVSIELDSGTDSLTGRISVGGAPPAAFFGWMELAHAIDLARLSRAADADAVTGDGGPPS
jgi:hypothetical protein